MRVSLRAFSVALLVAMPASAQTESLTEAWTAALDSHQRIAAAEAERDAAEDDLARARSERLPIVALTSSFLQVDEAPRFAFGDSFVSPPLFGNENLVMSSAQASLPLFTGGAIRSGIAAARFAAEASRSQLDAVRQATKLAVAERYIGVLRAEQAVIVADSNVVTLSAHTQDARNRFETGAVPRNDYLAAAVSLADAEQRKLQVENALDLARAGYNSILGRELATPVALDPELAIDTLVPGGRDLAALTELAQMKRPELAAIESQAGALRGRSDVERARSKPQIALSGGYSYLENQVLDDDRFWSVGIALRWRLFDSGRSGRRAAALAHRARSIEHQRGDLARLVALEVRQAWLDRAEAASRQRVATTALQQSVENLRVARERYRAGAGTSTEVLDAETLRARALGNHDNARFDAALAQLRLARAIGVL